MKKITLLIFILINSITYSQELFSYNENGLDKDYLVVEIDSLSNKELFKYSINYIKETYKSADDVILMEIEGEKIRFNGVGKNKLTHKALGMVFSADVKYTIELSFKNEKYQFKPTKLEVYNESSSYSRTGWYKVSLTDGSLYYKKNGTIRKATKNYIEDIPNVFNDVNLHLKDYLQKRAGIIKDEKDNW